jgi:hypothetical protein
MMTKVMNSPLQVKACHHGGVIAVRRRELMK